MSTANPYGVQLSDSVARYLERKISAASPEGVSERGGVKGPPPPKKQTNNKDIVNKLYHLSLYFSNKICYFEELLKLGFEAFKIITRKLQLKI